MQAYKRSATCGEISDDSGVCTTQAGNPMLNISFFKTENVLLCVLYREIRSFYYTEMQHNEFGGGGVRRPAGRTYSQPSNWMIGGFR